MTDRLSMCERWQVKELHRYGLLQADVIESMYRERLSMAKEAQRRRKEENKAVYRAQVRRQTD